MRKTNLLLGLLFTMGCLGSTASMAMQSESPVACVEGVEPLHMVYGDHTTGCEIKPILDLDQFTFNGTSGDSISIIVRTFANLPDPRLEIRDPDGSVISDTFCGTTTSNPCTLNVNLDLVKTGAYFIALSDKTNSGTGIYTVQLEKTATVGSPLELIYGAPSVSDIIDPPTDTDFFRFEGAASTDIRIVVRSFADWPDPRLKIWDPNGDVIIDTTCGTTTSNACSIPVDLSPALTGTYLVAISDASSSGTGNYDINLQCLFGTCPGVKATGPECDIQMSQATYIDGDTVTADVFRLANLTDDPLAIELKVWMGLPDDSFPVLNLGSDGSLVLPAGTDLDLGPLPLLPVSVDLPRGDFEFSCRMLDPTTSRLLKEDRNFFDIQ